MYYFISEDNGMLLESRQNLPSQERLQELADDWGCAYYVIEGQHAGITVEPSPDRDEMPDNLGPSA